MITSRKIISQAIAVLQILNVSIRCSSLVTPLLLMGEKRSLLQGSVCELRAIGRKPVVLIIFHQKT
ncbi:MULTISPECIES: hypothetical protein [Nostoc]|uniref:Uncharacterized protein n=1 Tax=Nostoc paludosum FACHB-159 TaxID=2692908 RepID=A0ABR8KJP8_9NOSO|nr:MULTISPECIES: hypothetical protein [Nostoc]MBD2682674.1 hypothetical protein [Nostoc sp. FACHB-857]MBD2739008.1 hypothetical protein [Nostoc paludosum FACHB-159]